MKQLFITLILSIVFLNSFTDKAIASTQQLEVKTLRINNYEMSYVERGSGEPLILVHGSLSDYRTWLPLMNEFSETNRTISVSLRHYYPEQWNGKSNDHSLQQHADDIVAFIQALQIGSVNLLGHSRGGDVALLVASQHPKLVSKLILADPAPFTSILENRSEVKTILDVRIAKFREVMKHYQLGDTESALEEFVNYIAGPTAWKNTSESRRNVLRSNKWTQMHQLNEIETPFNCTNAKTISSPVLLITGDYSAPLYSFMHSALTRCLKQSRKVMIADAGHLMFRSNPTAFLFEIQDFIDPQ